MINKTIDSQGIVSNSGSIIYTPSRGYIGHVDSIKFNNNKDKDYTIALYRYIAKSRTKILLYKYELSAGDMIDDIQAYQLKDGDYLFAVANSEVVFTINGTEIIKEKQ